MSDDEFFSDRELGVQPRVLDELPDSAWGGIVALFDRMHDKHMFAQDFPEHCQEHAAAIAGTSTANLFQSLRGLIPAFGDWPRSEVNPGTIEAMDLVEFAWKHAAMPRTLERHDWYRHDHLAFDQNAGREGWRMDVNLMLRRNQVALELGSDGKVRRLGPPAAQVVLERLLPTSGDEEIDRKLAVAVEKYRSPDIAIRKEGLEALWDAYERIKSMLDPHDKAAAIRSLIERMTPSEPWRTELDTDFRHLTNVGNQFHIRHFEANRLPVDDEMIDHLFVRTYSLVGEAVRALARP